MLADGINPNKADWHFRQSVFQLFKNLFWQPKPIFIPGKIFANEGCAVARALSRRLHDANSARSYTYTQSPTISQSQPSQACHMTCHLCPLTCSVIQLRSPPCLPVTPLQTSSLPFQYKTSQPANLARPTIPWLFVCLVEPQKSSPLSVYRPRGGGGGRGGVTVHTAPTLLTAPVP